MCSTLFFKIGAVAVLLRATAAQSTTPTFGAGQNYTTKTYNASATSTRLPNNDHSNERLAFLWNQVGPVATAAITTTVEAGPEATNYARPAEFHPLVPTYDTNLSNAKLPENFVWGVAASAYQVEGAVKDEGRGPSIWDAIAHRQANAVADNSTGDTVAQHYYLYKQDFARLASLGIPSFSPSFSWPRFFPFGKGPINAQGLAHYDDVVQTMVQNGIKPAITLFHWDTPLALFNEYGAWTDPQIVDDYFNYATFVITRYDQYVDHWFTINEPQYCNWQYSYYPAGTFYPAYNNITGGLPARILCSYHTLLAHAKVAKWYHNDFKGRGRITFKNSANYFEPNSTSPGDADAVQRNYDFVLGWFNNGPWNDGDYPQSVKDTLGDLLPALSEEDKALIKGSCDFFAVDPYTAYYAYEVDGGVENCTSNSSSPGFPECAGSVSTAPNGFPVGPAADNGVNWLYSTPAGIRRFLKVITQELFPSVPDIVVTEFGFAEPFEGEATTVNQILWDLRRADYYQGFLDNILASIYYDGVNVTGAYGWAICKFLCPPFRGDSCLPELPVT